MANHKTVFIADLHLDNHHPEILQAFSAYLQQLADSGVDAVYILGDLFEYWLGDDCLDQTAKTVARLLMTHCNAHHIPVYFIHGNRDFLLGETYAKQAGITLLPEQTVINLYGIETLIMHGDTLCTDDMQYMAFREKVRQPIWQNKVLRYPVWFRRLLAMRLRYRSKKANARKPDAILDVSRQTVEQVMSQYNVGRLIHGHTHRPAIHSISLPTRTNAQRCVVGDWYEQGSVIEVSGHDVELITLPL